MRRSTLNVQNGQSVEARKRKRQLIQHSATTASQSEQQSSRSEGVQAGQDTETARTDGLLRERGDIHVRLPSARSRGTGRARRQRLLVLLKTVDQQTVRTAASAVEVAQGRSEAAGPSSTGGMHMQTRSMQTARTHRFGLAGIARPSTAVHPPVVWMVPAVAIARLMSVGVRVAAMRAV
jgi:hypothetical protein